MKCSCVVIVMATLKDRVAAMKDAKVAGRRRRSGSRSLHMIVYFLCHVVDLLREFEQRISVGLVATWSRVQHLAHQ